MNTKETYSIMGMHCASCKTLIESTLKDQKGIKSAKVNFATEQAKVEFDPEVISFDQIEKKVNGLGDYKITEINEESAEEVKSKKQEVYLKLKKKLALVGVAVVPFALIMVYMTLGFFNIIEASHSPFGKTLGLNTYFVLQFILSSFILFYGGKSFFTSAFNAFKNKSANMDTLVVLGTFTAWAYSTVITFAKLPGEVFFEAAAFIIFFILLGRTFEAKAKSQTNDAVKKLFELQAKYANKLVDGKEQQVPIEEVEKNDILIIRPGEKIPVDGIIVEGSSSIDESSVTGESVPVEKQINDEVIGSTINKMGVIHIKATKVGKETLLAQIIKLVEEAQGSQAPIQKLADKISGIFVPIVIMIAILSFVFWMFIAPQLGILTDDNVLSISIYIATTILIIACPCALGLATPTAVMVGTGKAARKGILIKSAETLEKSHLIDTIVFDKTGTLTEGKPVVTDIVCDGIEESDAISMAAAVEDLSEHPLSKAITSYGEKEKVDYGEHKVENFEAIGGMGVKASIGEKEIIIGNDKIADKYQLEEKENLKKQIKKFQEQGKTVVTMFIDKKAVAIFCLLDVPKENAKEQIRRLHDKGIKIVMLTGDNHLAADYIAKEIGIDEVIAEVLPTEKAKEIQKLQKDNNFVAMVGDGVNDAPALAQADISIAMGTGTDIAKEAGDIILVQGTLEKVTESIEVSRKTLKTIKQNLFWAFCYNIVAIPVAAGVLLPISGILLSPIIASAAMAFSSVSVVLNSLRLKNA